MINKQIQKNNFFLFVLKFYLTVENSEKLKKAFINLNAFYIIDIQEILKSTALDLNKPFNTFLINNKIEKMIASQAKSKMLQGIIYINKNLNLDIVNQLYNMLEKQSKEIKHYRIENMVLIDSQDNPKVKNLWKNFDEVMFFPTIKRIKIVESQFVCFN